MWCLLNVFIRSEVEREVIDHSYELHEEIKFTSKPYIGNSFREAVEYLFIFICSLYRALMIYLYLSDKLLLIFFFLNLDSFHSIRIKFRTIELPSRWA